MFLYKTNYYKDEWECIYLTAIGAKSFARARPQEVANQARGSLLCFQKQSQYITEEIDSGILSVALTSALDRSFTFGGLFHTRFGYQLGGTYPEHCWHHDHAAFLQVGSPPFFGCHVLKLDPRPFEYAATLAFGVSKEGRSWLCFVDKNTKLPWSPSQRVLSSAECLKTPLDWSREVRSSMIGSISQYGIFRGQKEDMLALGHTKTGPTWYVTARLTADVRGSCTTYVIKLQDEIIMCSEGSPGKGRPGSRAPDGKSRLMKGIGC